MLSEGRIAFLCDEEKAIICDFLCQCPRTGNHHFYTLQGQKSRFATEGVNALERAIIISTKVQQRRIYRYDVCQCPRTGNHHFYFRVIAGQDTVTGCVNALERAIIISTGVSTIRLGIRSSVSSFLHGTANLSKVSRSGGVNALERAIIISTLPLKIC